MLKQLFSKKYWQIKYANFKILKFRYLYSVKSTVIFFISVPIAVIIALCISLPAWLLDKAKDLFTDHYPQCLKITENPLWTHEWNFQKRQEFLHSLKTWE
jgi:hypothetical protein